MLLPQKFAYPYAAFLEEVQPSEMTKCDSLEVALGRADEPSSQRDVALGQHGFLMLQRSKLWLKRDGLFPSQLYSV